LVLRFRGGLVASSAFEQIFFGRGWSLLGSDLVGRRILRWKCSWEWPDKLIYELEIKRRLMFLPNSLMTLLIDIFLVSILIYLDIGSFCHHRFGSVTNLPLFNISAIIKLFFFIRILIIEGVKRGLMNFWRIFRFQQLSIEGNRLIFLTLTCFLEEWHIYVGLSLVYRLLHFVRKFWIFLLLYWLLVTLVHHRVTALSINVGLVGNVGAASVKIKGIAVIKVRIVDTC